MSTNVSGFQSFFPGFLEHFVLAKLATTSMRVYFAKPAYIKHCVHMLSMVNLCHQIEDTTVVMLRYVI